MSTITIDEIQRDWKRFLQRVKAGETLVLLESDQPVAEIKPIGHNGEGLRPYALFAGAFRIPDDFDAPLPSEILDQFEGR